jgi:cell pole-organizing protein PopZ
VEFDDHNMDYYQGGEDDYSTSNDHTAGDNQNYPNLNNDQVEVDARNLDIVPARMDDRNPLSAETLAAVAAAVAQVAT